MSKRSKSNLKSKNTPKMEDQKEISPYIVEMIVECIRREQRRVAANSKIQCNFVNEIKTDSKMEHSINERDIGNGFI